MRVVVLTPAHSRCPPSLWLSQIKDKASSGWSVQPSPTGDLVALPKTEHNQLVVKRTQEIIRLEQVAPVLRAVTVGFE